MHTKKQIFFVCVPSGSVTLRIGVLSVMEKIYFQKWSITGFALMLQMVLINSRSISDNHSPGVYLQTSESRHQWTSLNFVGHTATCLLLNTS